MEDSGESAPGRRPGRGRSVAAGAPPALGWLRGGRRWRVRGAVLVQPPQGAGTGQLSPLPHPQRPCQTSHLPAQERLQRQQCLHPWLGQHGLEGASLLLASLLDINLAKAGRYKKNQRACTCVASRGSLFYLISLLICRSASECHRCVIRAELTATWPQREGQISCFMKDPKGTSGMFFTRSEQIFDCRLALIRLHWENKPLLCVGNNSAGRRWIFERTRVGEEMNYLFSISVSWVTAQTINEGLCDVLPFRRFSGLLCFKYSLLHQNKLHKTPTSRRDPWRIHEGKEILPASDESQRGPKILF